MYSTWWFYLVPKKLIICKGVCWFTSFFHKIGHTSHFRKYGDGSFTYTLSFYQISMKHFSTVKLMYEIEFHCFFLVISRVNILNLIPIWSNNINTDRQAKNIAGFLFKPLSKLFINECHVKFIEAYFSYKGVLRRPNIHFYHSINIKSLKLNIFNTKQHYFMWFLDFLKIVT